jgi:hypothetical protein
MEYNRSIDKMHNEKVTAEKTIIKMKMNDFTNYNNKYATVSNYLSYCLQPLTVVFFSFSVFIHYRERLLDANQ